MAQKFGGKFSPSGSDAQSQAVAEDKAVNRSIAAAGRKSAVLYLPAILLVFTSLNEGAGNLLLGLIAGGSLALAAWMLGEGLRAEAAYNARTIARRPAVPRKMLATALTGIGITIAAFTGTSGVVASVLYGVAAAGLHVAAFGIDPLRNKRMDGIDTFQQDRVARVVDEAESYLSNIADQIGALRDRHLDQRVTAFQAVARKMIRTVEEDPRDLTSARKYLGVYLMGARDATVAFVDVFRRSGDPSARKDYEALLTDLESNFAARTDKLLEGDRSDMDVEIKVLRDRLSREGVHTE